MDAYTKHVKKKVNPKFYIHQNYLSKANEGASPGGSVVKKLPANAGYGSVPSKKFPHAAKQLSLCVKLLSLCSRVWELQLWSPCATTTGAQHLEPMLCKKRSHCSEKPVHHN